MEKVVRYGIAGCGTHAFRGHYRPGKLVPGLQLVALFDPDASKYPDAQAFTQDAAEGVVMYRDYASFLAHPDLDAVVIVSPDRFHTAQLDAAVEAGKHALVDKPAAANMADIIQLHVTLDKARARGLVVSSCHPRRFNPAYTQLRDLVEKTRDTLGDPINLSLDFSYHVPRAERTDLHTGMLADHMNHEFDFMNFLFGHADCDAVRLLNEKDRYEAAGLRTDKIAFHFSGTRRLRGKNYPETVRVRFTRGELTVHTKTYTGLCENLRLEYPGNRSMAMWYAHEDTSSAAEVESPSEIHLFPCHQTNYEFAFHALMTDFVAAINEGKAPYLTRDDIYFNSLICVELTERKSCSIVFPK